MCPESSASVQVRNTRIGPPPTTVIRCLRILSVREDRHFDRGVLVVLWWSPAGISVVSPGGPFRVSWFLQVVSRPPSRVLVLSRGYRPVGGDRARRGRLDCRSRCTVSLFGDLHWQIESGL